MLPPFKTNPVNWVDGMKINKDHFLHTDKHFAETIRDARALHLNHFNYGLCPSHEEGSSSLSISLSVDASKVIRAVLSFFRAVTPGGYRMEFGYQKPIKVNADTSQLNAELSFDDSKENTFYVLLHMSSRQIPIGQPDSEEIPPRIPYVTSEYTIQILPESQINLHDSLGNSLLLGKFRRVSGKMKVDENFIPPCTMVRSFPKLMDDYYHLGNLLGETAKNISVIISKIQEKSQSTTLTKSCMALCNDASDYLATILGDYRWLYANMPPVYFLSTYLKFAYRFNTSLSNLPVKDREELLNYICEWIEENTSETTEIISTMIKMEYDHNDIAAAVEKASNFMELTHKIFGKLAQLDFIGKRKGEGAFVQERKVEEKKDVFINEDNTSAKNKRSGWSFMEE